MFAFLHGDPILFVMFWLLIVLIVLCVAYAYNRTVWKGGEKRSSSNKKTGDGE